MSIMGCATSKNDTSPDVPEVFAIPISEDARAYPVEYNVIFRTAVDSLSHIDVSGPKLVKAREGVILFSDPEGFVTIKAKFAAIDAETTQVEMSYDAKKKLSLDKAKREIGEALFTELERRLRPRAEEKSVSDVSARRDSASGDPGAEEIQQKERKLLKEKLSKEFGLEEEQNFLRKLSYDELVILARKLSEIESISREKQKLGKRCAACYIDMARLYHDKGEYSRAEKTLKTAIEIDPGNAFAHCSLGEIYKHLSLFDDSIRELNNAMILDPDLPDSYINLGIVYDDYVHDDQKALKNYRKYLDLGGSDEQVHEWIRQIEDDAGKKNKPK